MVFQSTYLDFKVQDGYEIVVTFCFRTEQRYRESQSMRSDGFEKKRIDCPAKALVLLDDGVLYFPGIFSMGTLSQEYSPVGFFWQAKNARSLDSRSSSKIKSVRVGRARLLTVDTDLPRSLSLFCTLYRRKSLRDTEFVPFVDATVVLLSAGKESPEGVYRSSVTGVLGKRKTDDARFHSNAYSIAPKVRLKRLMRCDRSGVYSSRSTRTATYSWKRIWVVGDNGKSTAGLLSRYPKAERVFPPCCFSSSF